MAALECARALTLALDEKIKKKPTFNLAINYLADELLAELYRPSSPMGMMGSARTCNRLAYLGRIWLPVCAPSLT